MDSDTYIQRRGMKLCRFTFMVRDLERSAAFYQDLAGLRVLRRFNPGPGEIVFLANGEGETMLELIQFDSAEKVRTQGMVMSFAAEGALEPLREKAAALGYSPSAIIDWKPKPPHFTVADPDGIRVEFSL